MNLLQQWFDRFSCGMERRLVLIVLWALFITVISQTVLIFEAGRQFLSLVDILEGGPWPPH